MNNITIEELLALNATVGMVAIINDGQLVRVEQEVTE